MSWFILALFSALFHSASELVEKKTLAHVRSIDLSASIAFSHFFFALPFLLFIDWGHFNAGAMLFSVASAFLAALAFTLAAKAFRHLEISFVSPLLTLSPGIVAVLAYLIIDEKINRLGVLGIIFLVAGSYILSLHPEHRSSHIFEIFTRSRYVNFAFVAVFCYSLMAVVDRYALGEIGIPFANYFFFTQVFVALFLIPAVNLFGGGFGSVRKSFVKDKGKIIVTSLLTFISRALEMSALVIAFAGLVAAIKRSSSLFTVLIGGELWREKNLGRRVFACVIIVFGVVLLVL